MTTIVVVDDMRYFPDLDCTYLRTLDEAMEWLNGYMFMPIPVELWLDHDLGGDEDVRPLVIKLEEFLARHPQVPMEVRIVSDNPAGRKYIRQALEDYVPVIDEPAPRWRMVEEDE